MSFNRKKEINNKRDLVSKGNAKIHIEFMTLQKLLQFGWKRDVESTLLTTSYVIIYSDLAEFLKSKVLSSVKDIKNTLLSCYEPRRRNSTIMELAKGQRSVSDQTDYYITVKNNYVL